MGPASGVCWIVWCTTVDEVRGDENEWGAGPYICWWSGSLDVAAREEDSVS